jgi:hypothetical protein
MARRDKGSWLAEARDRMEKKGTVGKFGPATAKKIARGKKAGGIQKKRAVFAANMRKIAAKHRRQKRSAD